MLASQKDQYARVTRGNGTMVSNVYLKSELAPRLGAGLLAQLDREADRRHDGGFKLGKNRSNVCDRCFTTRSVNGTCGC